MAGTPRTERLHAGTMVALLLAAGAAGIGMGTLFWDANPSHPWLI